MASLLSIAKRVLFGEKKPEEVLDNGVGKTAKEVITGNESKTAKSSSVASKGNIGAVGATAQKDEELVNSAIRDIRSGKYTTQEQKAAIERFQTRIDNAVAAGRVPSQRDQQTLINLREARAYGVYQSFKEQAGGFLILLEEWAAGRQEFVDKLQPAPGRATGRQS